MKILICNDGSEQAERAMRLGATIAAACQAEVTLLGIQESPGDAQALLDSLKRGQSFLEDKKIHAELITKSGKPIEEIIKRTRETVYDLVVIGAARKETRGAFWMSSKTYKLIKEIRSPVLSVAGKATSINRILICSGGKRYIDAAVLLTGQIARGLGVTVTLLHVTSEPPGIFARLPRMEDDATFLLRSKSELAQNLRREKETLEALGVRTEAKLRHGGVLDQILHEIRDGNYALVVTGSALSRSFRTYILGDITREILNRATCAVLVARGQPILAAPHFPLKWFSKTPRSPA
jgi:nucleotide-binding universal stress UspA family protein